MFWIKKNNKKLKTQASDCKVYYDKKNDFNAFGYVGIYELSLQLAFLNNLAQAISEITFNEEGESIDAIEYKKNIKKAFIQEFESKYENVFHQSMTYDYYRKTCSMF